MYSIGLCLSILLLLSCSYNADAFVPSSIKPSLMMPSTTTPFQQRQYENRGFTKNSLQQPQPQPQSSRMNSNIRLYGLFGLGAPEIIVILIAAAFVLGPQKLAELGKDAGKIAGELKEVPKEFQAGLMEGEKQAKIAKQMDETKTTIADANIESTKKE